MGFSGFRLPNLSRLEKEETILHIDITIDVLVRKLIRVSMIIAEL